MKEIIVVAGLGNPGEEYKNTRHNIGFRIVDRFAAENNFSEFFNSKKFKALISEGFLNNRKIILVKPLTFMNNSGTAIAKITRQYKVEPKNLFVIHDDVDLFLGKIKIVKNRGAAGHKGVASIIKALGTKNFVRIRIGIANQELLITNYELRKRQKAIEVVLEKFSKSEEKIVQETIKTAGRTIGLTISEGIEKAMNEFNRP